MAYPPSFRATAPQWPFRRVAEDGKVAVRHARQEANKELKRRKDAHELSEDDAKREIDRVQKLTDEYIAKVDSLLKSKEEEVMEV